MHSLGEQFGRASALNQVTIPDLWQHQAVSALREGHDVVVHAPTGAGKTLIFELWSNQGKNRGQAIYTVPTRALANDKLAEWRARGWAVGIATGDLANELDAPILVATLETQKNKLIREEGPALLVVDEYQMLGDSNRGLNYELAMAMSPPRTQLLLLSGSVSNPQQVVSWLQRLGRRAVLIRHTDRPVPQEEVFADTLRYNVPSNIRGYWPRFLAKALAEDLGPVLVFAPRRQMAESIAAELAGQLPIPNPLELRPDQKQLVGDHLAKLLRSRIAYHHSGLSYAARAGVVEPLAKAGQLRIVVATMGLAAGINFSLRSVVLAGDSYRRDSIEQPLRADEILQMFGRAGRRGIDEVGFVLVSANQIRLMEGSPAYLSRSGLVDWSTLLGLMAVAADQQRDPYREAVRVQERLFSTKPVVLGVEESLKHPTAPCGLKTDSERARHVRKRLRELLNSQGHWQRIPPPSTVPLGEIWLPDSVEHPGTPPTLRPALSEPTVLENVGHGTLCLLSETEPKTYGRAVTVADKLNDNRIQLVKWVRRLINWKGRQAPGEIWQEQIAPLLAEQMRQQRTPVVRFQILEHKIVAWLSLAEQTLRVPVDAHGVALCQPQTREVMHEDCAGCEFVPTCRTLSPATGVAMVWRRLGLIDSAGVPTRRGKLVSFFTQGDGLAVAAALEDCQYPLEELIYDLANLDAGFRFANEDDRWGGRLAMACRALYSNRSIPGYLENGLPPRYGTGAEQIVAAVHKNPLNKNRWITEWLGAGDIDRIIIEWRSLLRRIAHAPALEWPRWSTLQSMARDILRETESPTLIDLPPLDSTQSKRADHRLIFRRQ